MDSLDIQIVDNLTVNLNQEEYSTEGQVLNGINVYVEDEQLLFEAALTQDSINLYTRETPDIINIKEITDGISKLESLIQKTSKEATLLAKVAELKEALNSVDFTAIEQAIQDVEDVTAKEATLIQGVGDIIKAVDNIDFTDLENSIAEVKDAVENIDFSALAKEKTLTQGIASVQSKVEEVGNKIDNIRLPEIDTTELAKESTLEEVKGIVKNVASIDADILNGKIKIASAISQKGIPANYTNSLVDMATKIGQIPQELYTGTTDYDEMQFPMECSYNAYRFAKDLMESELPAKYPSYLRDYLVGYGANSFWVGEFAIPYEEVLVLSMADAYYTSDGHFYTHIDGVVTHTFPDGSVETYESDVLEHKCPFNGMGNILIAHIYASNIYTVGSYNNTNLIGVITCGKCDLFELKFHISYISGIGELNNVSMRGCYTKNSKFLYNPLIIKGMKKNNKALIQYDSSTPFNKYKSIILPDLEEFNEVIFSHGGGECYCEILILPNLKKNNAYISAIYNNNTHIGVVFFTAGLIKLHKSIFCSPGAGADHYLSIKTLHLPELEDMNGFLFNDGMNGYFARDLERIYTPKLKRLTLGVFHQANTFSVYYSYADKRSLIDFEVGEVETDMTLQFWSATNVLADPEKTIQLQNNIHNHIAERVKDVTGEAPLTITFSQGVRDVLLPETETLFAAKNWNIAPTRTE